ncbi:hypothetical protein JOF53_003831 [Crossiella equi]|uniref:Uncharacterized protein n=1 Tax=Crossiella equi TaxID=130796 RepID=A0ABS5AEE8_9PSEU|nr:hypothetical protein [Crossiella equi]MBP2474959.1 hypothetical protein [Crossiella equi]
MTEGQSASERYRAITGQVDEALRRMHKVDGERAKELADVVRTTKATLDTKDKQLADVQETMSTWWKHVGTLFYEERWFRMKHIPKPMRPLPGHTVEQLVQDAARAQNELSDLLRRKPGLMRRG